MLDNNIKVSVIMATYNTPEEYLKEAIKSILNQTYKNLEFIIICDGNENEAKFIQNNFDDKRIKLIIHNQNKGLPKSLNEGIEISTGKYIVRMDSDDISLKDRIKIQVDFMEKHEEIVLCSMYAKCIGEGNKIKGSFFTKPNEVDIQLLYENCIIHPTAIIRSKFFKENNIKYNEEYICSQDYELWSRIADNNIRILKKVGLLFRIHKKQVSQSKGGIQKQLRKEIVLNNLKQSIYLDENIIQTFMVLAALEKMTKDNYRDVSNSMDYFIKTNNIFNRKTLKKVLYIRYFQIFLNSETLKIKTVHVLFDKNIRNKIINLYNLKYIFFKSRNIVKSFF